MPVRIVKASDPIVIKTIIVGVYALPGIGKSSVGQTAHAPLTLDFDKGIHRARNRRDSIPIDNWRDVEDLNEDDLAPYSTIVIDTVGRCLDVMTSSVLSGSNGGKMGNGAGGLSLRGFGVLKIQFTHWLNKLRSWGKDIILIAHMDEKNEGDVKVERLDVQGGSKAEIYKSVDAMAKLYVEGRDRKLDFSPREGSLGKNPAQLDIITVPNFVKEPEFLGNLMDSIKATINGRTAEQTAAAGHVDEWRKRIEALDTQAGYNDLLPLMESEPQEVRLLLNVSAEARGLKYDKKLKGFVDA